MAQKNLLLQTLEEPTILLFSTEGCEGCEIVKNLVKEIIKERKLSITLKIINKNSVSNNFLKINKITDFPSVLFVNNERVVFKFTGVYPKIVIDKWIEINFNT